MITDGSLRDNGALVIDQGLKFGRGLAERVRRLEAAPADGAPARARAACHRRQRARGCQDTDARGVVAAILLEQAIDIQRAACSLVRQRRKSASK